LNNQLLSYLFWRTGYPSRILKAIWLPAILNLECWLSVATIQTNNSNDEDGLQLFHNEFILERHYQCRQIKQFLIWIIGSLLQEYKLRIVSSYLSPKMWGKEGIPSLIWGGWPLLWCVFLWQRNLQKNSCLWWSTRFKVKRTSRIYAKLSKRNTFISPKICVDSVMAARLKSFLPATGKQRWALYTALMWAHASAAREREGKSDIWSLATSGLEQREGQKLFSDNTEFQPQQQNKSLWIYVGALYSEKLAFALLTSKAAKEHGFEHAYLSFSYFVRVEWKCLNSQSIIKK
jgi:hypothetical protein